MTKPTRVRRPKAQRTQPDRSFVGRSRSERNGQAESAPDDAEHRDPRSSSYEAVNSAYRVIDEYMRQGQRLAEEFWLPSSGAGRQAAAEVPRMIDRFVRSASEMGSAWLELMASTTTPAQKDGIRGTAGPFGAGKRAQEASRRSSSSGLTVAVESQKPVRISIDAPDGLRDLQVSALVSMDQSTPPLTGVEVEVDANGEAILRVVVPPGQPSGRYHGVLLDRRTERPVGTASLIVE